MKEDTNKSGKSNCCSIILKTLQNFSKNAPANDYSDIPPAGRELVATEAIQKALGIIVLLTILGIEDPIKVDKNLNHNAFEDEKDIAAEITQLKKKQKKLK